MPLKNHRSDRDGHGGDDLREATSAKFAGHQAREDEHGDLRQHRKETQSDERSSEQGQSYALEERRDGRICDVAKCEVARVVDHLQLVPVETVPTIGEHVQRRDEQREQNQNNEIAAR